MQWEVIEAEVVPNERAQRLCRDGLQADELSHDLGQVRGLRIQQVELAHDLAHLAQPKRARTPLVGSISSPVSSRTT